MGTYIDEFEEWIFGGEFSENRTVADLIVCGEVLIICTMKAIKRKGYAALVWGI